MAAEAVVVEGGQKVAMVDEEGHQSRSNQLQECAARLLEHNLVSQE